MKIQIRRGIFETNSSSMHSLTVGKCEDYTEDYNNKEITLGLGEYGWGYEYLDIWFEKADYLSIETEYDKQKKDLLVKVLKRKYPNAEISFNYEGDIDHQSRGEIWDYILTSHNPEEELYNIVFGSNNIIIDNDNH